MVTFNEVWQKVGVGPSFESYLSKPELAKVINREELEKSEVGEFSN